MLYTHPALYACIYTSLNLIGPLKIRVYNEKTQKEHHTSQNFLMLLFSQGYFCTMAPRYGSSEVCVCGGEKIQKSEG